MVVVVEEEEEEEEKEEEEEEEEAVAPAVDFLVYPWALAALFIIVKS